MRRDVVKCIDPCRNHNKQSRGNTGIVYRSHLLIHHEPMHQDLCHCKKRDEYADHMALTENDPNEIYSQTLTYLLLF